MQIIDNNQGACHKGYVATIGFFDGVHAGHRWLLNCVRNEAAIRDLGSMAVTFDKHPREVLHSSYCPHLLTTAEERMEQLQTTGIDKIVVLSFDRQMADMSAYDFLKLLEQEYAVKVLMIGYDHRFGKDRKEGFCDYVRYGKEIGVEVIKAPLLPEDGVATSSSKIRQLLQEGKVKQAEQRLSYYYSLSGVVVKGSQIGRTIGFPTANLSLANAQKVLPAHGVYAVWVRVDGKRYMGMLNIGCKPTFGETDDVIPEVHLIDFEGDLYGKELRVFFIHYLREEQKMETPLQLIAQLQQDKAKIIELLSK